MKVRTPTSNEGVRRYVRGIDVFSVLAAGPVAMGLRKQLVDIQYGRVADPHGWIRAVV